MSRTTTTLRRRCALSTMPSYLLPPGHPSPDFSQFYTDLASNHLPGGRLHLDTQQDEHPPGNGMERAVKPRSGRWFTPSCRRARCGPTSRSSSLMTRAAVPSITLLRRKRARRRTPPSIRRTTSTASACRSCSSRRTRRRRLCPAHRVHSHTSTLRFVELIHDLPALTNRDANSDALLELFDFDCPSFITPPVLPAAA